MAGRPPPEERPLFRSTFFPPSGKLLKGSALDTLAGEIEGIIHPDRQKHEKKGIYERE